MFEMVRGGMDVDLVVSLHGLLSSRPLRHPVHESHVEREKYDDSFRRAENTYGNKRMRIMVQNGDSDPFGRDPPLSVGNRPEGSPHSDFADWKKEMNVNGITWEWTDYGGATHGFALPADICNDYHEVADRRSTLAMLAALSEIWADVKLSRLPCNAAGTLL